jgi:hypothetical protein
MTDAKLKAEQAALLREQTALKLNTPVWNGTRATCLDTSNMRANCTTTSREGDLVTLEFKKHDDGRSVTLHARCPRRGAVTTATITMATMAEHIRTNPTSKLGGFY